MRGRLKRLDADGSTLQVGDAAYALSGEELEAADMNPGQNGSAQASIDLEKKWTREVQIEVDVAVSPYSFVLCSAATNEPGFDVNDICKPLLFQQIAYHVHRRDADTWALRESDRGSFWRRIGLFGPEPSGNAPKQRSGGGEASRQQQVATIRMHWDLLETP